MGVRESAPVRARVLVVDDHELLAQSLAVALRAEGCEVRVPRLSSTSFLLEDVDANRPDVVLLDLDLGAGIDDGVALVPELVARGATVLVVSGATDRARPAAALEAGAVGYVAKSESFERLVATVLDAAEGRTAMDSGRRHELLTVLRRQRRALADQLSPFEALTPRERAVLVGLGSGQSVAAIARQSVVSEATVRSQVRGILTKLGVPSQLAAVARAREAGWPPSSSAS